jgi:hypothetical protein
MNDQADTRLDSSIGHETNVSITPLRKEPVERFLFVIKDSLINRYPWLNGYIVLTSLGSVVLFGSTLFVSVAESYILRNDSLAVFIGDIAAPIHFSILNPLALTLIVLYHESISEFIMSQSGLLSIGNGVLDSELRQIITLYNSKLINLASICIALVATIGFFYWRLYNGVPYYFQSLCKGPPYQLYPCVISFSGIVTGFWGFLVTYAIVVWTCRSWITIVLIGTLSKHEIRYEATHPDMKAGFGKFGSIISHTGIMIVVIGITISLFWIPFLLMGLNGKGLNVSDMLFIFIGIAIYVVASLLFTYLMPLWQVHTSMTRARAIMLERLMSLHEARGNPNLLEQFYGVASNLPSWPIQIVNLSTIITTILGSLIIPLVVNYLSPPR